MGKKEPKQDVFKLMPVLRIFSGLFLLVILTALILAIFLTGSGNFVPVFEIGNPTLMTITVILLVVSVILLILAYYVPALFKRLNKDGFSEQSLFMMFILRVTLFEFLAIIGMVLRIMGNNWYICGPLFAISILGIILLFPTKKRYAGWIGISDY